jgi:thiol-disulfide isomerase/thioredoxin
MAATKSAKDAINGIVTQCLIIVDEEVKRALERVGEEAVATARNEHPGNWIDRTGNLRSSIGYGIYREGRKQLESMFGIVKNGGEGAEKGKKMLDELSKLYAENYALIVVAGMNYAGYVEARDYDVLAGAEIKARQIIDKYLQAAKKRIEERFNKLVA